jgi:hypothetical protein
MIPLSKHQWNGRTCAFITKIKSSHVKIDIDLDLTLFPSVSYLIRITYFMCSQEVTQSVMTTFNENDVSSSNLYSSFFCRHIYIYKKKK